MDKRAKDPDKAALSASAAALLARVQEELKAGAYREAWEHLRSLETKIIQLIELGREDYEE